jgi:hypothetical protein
MTGNSRTAIPSDGTHSTARLLDIAKLGYAQWLFGNIYESVVKIPERLATDPNRTSVLGPGSPLRYYAPVLPVTVATTAAAFITGWGIEGARRWLAMTAGCSISGLAITGYLVRRVNLKVMFAASPPPEAERDALIDLWHRLNLVRIAAVTGAWFAAHRTNAAISRQKSLREHPLAR